VHALFHRDDREDEHERHDDDPSGRTSVMPASRARSNAAQTGAVDNGVGIGLIRVAAPPGVTSGAGEAVTLDGTAGAGSWATAGVTGAERT
jgi:hypothetical protein